jgi:hypothetical protein
MLDTDQRNGCDGVQPRVHDVVRLNETLGSFLLVHECLDLYLIPAVHFAVQVMEKN